MTKVSGHLSGHALEREGAAFTSRGNLIGRWGTSGPGHGRCSCGEISPELPSGTQRKAWHREHKNSIRGNKA